MLYFYQTFSDNSNYRGKSLVKVFNEQHANQHVAKVWLRKGSGKIIVNGKNLDNYFKRDTYQMQILRPFEIINQSSDYDVNCKVVGGGLTGQAGALVHGISKALVQLNSELKSALKKEKLTTRDSRSVERKKPGRAKARRSYQFSKR